MRTIAFISLLVTFISCKQENKSLTAQQIVDKTIENAGGDRYQTAKIEFTFRNVRYSSSRNNGLYEFTKTATDSLGETYDVLTNNAFERYVNSTKLILHDSVATKYSNALNSVHYFVQLPFGLNDAAVNKKLVGETELTDKEYYKLQVTFTEDGGGSDHEDEYIYWIEKNDFTIDYFAYKFYSGKGGIRFRKAFNPRVINGVRFVDYKNYKLDDWKNVDLQHVDTLYTAGKLQLLSEIITEDISVSENKTIN
ncbi:MAG: deoxyribose-phosphate aldolase [Aequorivita sp.]|nr:deoxyribose-phosphate aldolase [Aequorivita sp.]|tara:strand:- start:264 stop:1019 length:756 start_codon:yes stop_codon:yes gene_type:complete